MSKNGKYGYWAYPNTFLPIVGETKYSLNTAVEFIDVSMSRCIEIMDYME